MKFTHFLILISLLLTACVERGKVEVSGLESATPSVTDVNFKDGKLHIKGSALHSAKKVRIDDTTLKIESQNESSLVASAKEALSLTTSAVFDLVISNAQGSSTYPIQLVISDGDVTTAKLADGAVTASKLDDMGATTGQVLKYDGTQWTVSDLGNLTYSGNWNADENDPDLTEGGVPGEYHIVNVAGTYDLNGGPGTNDWAVGDWVIWNETKTRWEKINNASNVTSFAGRSGPVVPESGDYTWDQIDKTTAPIDDLSDVDTSTTTPNSGEVLKWDGSNWVPDTDNDSGGVTDVTGTLPIESSGGSTPDISITQAGSGSNGYLSSGDWNTFNDKAEEPSSACSGTDKLTWDGSTFSCEADVDTNTNASTVCSGSDYLAGDGTCQSAASADTNAGTECASGEYLDGDGTCKTAATADGEFLADGSVAMTGDFDGGGFDLTNVGSLFTSNQAGVTLNSFGSSAGQTGELRFNDLDDTNYVAFKADDAVSSNVTWTLPNADGGSGNVLTTDGSGNLSWSSSGDGSVTEVNGTSPISSTGGTTPDISISQADSTTNGYLSSTDWNTFNDKQDAITTGNTSEYLRGDLSLSSFSSDVADSVLSDFATGSDTTVTNTDTVETAVEKIQGQINANDTSIAGKQDDLSAPGDGAQYLDGNETWQTLDTSAVTENGNLYFSESRVLDTLLSGHSTGADETLSDGDTLLEALAKLEGQIQADASNAFLKDGSVAMTGDFDGGGNDLTNVGSLVTNNQAGATLNPFGTNTGETGELRFMELEANGTNYLGFKAPDALSTNQVWRLPGSDGADGEALVTDGSGVLSWAGSLPPSGDAGGELNGSYPDPEIADGVIDSANLTTDSVTSAEIAADAVGTSEIATNGVDSDEIAADAVGTSEIATDGVDSAEIATGAVNTDELAADSVTSAKIADGEIVDADVNASADIDATKLGTGVVDNTEFNYLDGLSGDIQTQLDEKLNVAGDDMEGPLTVPENEFTVGTNQITTDSGNVGIGTTSPQYLLHLDNASGDEGSPGLFIQDPTTDNSHGGKLYFDDRSGLNAFKLSSLDAGVETGYLAIDRSTGSVGIGTASPSRELEVNSTTNDRVARFTSDDDKASIDLKDSNSEYSVIEQSSNGLSLSADSGTSDNLIVTPSGNVGVGTTTPGEKMEVNGNVKGNQFIGHMEGRGRVCPQGHYYAMGYCLEKTLHYTPRTNCDGVPGTLHNGICEDMSGNAGSCKHGTLSEAYTACNDDGGRLPTPAELDRLDGSGCGFDRANTWVQFAESSAEINDRDTGIGQCTRRSTHLNNAPLDTDEATSYDEIAHCNHVTTFDHQSVYTSGQIGAIHCVYDP